MEEKLWINSKKKKLTSFDIRAKAIRKSLNHLACQSTPYNPTAVVITLGEMPSSIHRPQDNNRLPAGYAARQ
jgi:hypothetical protein